MLSRAEQETTINFNKAEDIAHIFTYEKTWQQHLEKKLKLKPTMDNGFGGKGYQIEKKRIRPPRARRTIKLSAEQRKRIGERLRKRPLSKETVVPAIKSTKRTTGEG